MFRRTKGVRAMKAHRTSKREPAPGIDAKRAEHLTLASREIMTESGIGRVTVNDSESPLAWLARRKGRDVRTMIGHTQFIAGEKLRADFTRGHLAPRVTSSRMGVVWVCFCGG